MTTASGAGAAFAGAIMEALGNGHAIRSAREGIRVSQSALAREMGVHPSFIAKVEAGERTMTADLTQRCWQALATLDENYRRPVAIRIEGEHAIASGVEQV
jgi:predicted transcriptional regulator